LAAGLSLEVKIETIPGEEPVALICHITQRKDWDTLHSQGFIHCSTLQQVIPVANLLFRGKADLVLFSINESLVHPAIRNESLEGTAELFRHIYGPLNLGAIIQVMDFPPRQDGTFVLPVEVMQLS
jgi:uncharacterized protein (DUF952 family)